MDSLLDQFHDVARRLPDRVAIVDSTGADTTFHALAQRSSELAGIWQSKVKHGDRVLLAMGVNADLYASLAALWDLGATVVLPEPSMGLAGLRHAARVTNVTAFCCAGMYQALGYVIPELWRLPHLTPISGNAAQSRSVQPLSDDIALISFTSGTTGTPKAIPRSHAFLTAQHSAIAPILDSDVAQRDLVAFPVFVLINIASGRTSILPNWKMSKLDKLSPQALTDWMSQHKVSRALLPPALCEKLAQATPPAHLKTIFTGGGPVFPDLIKKLKNRDGELKVVAVYGSTEAEPISHLDTASVTDADYEKMASGHGLLVGHPTKETGIKIVDDEILVTGPHVNSGYLDPRHDAGNKQRDGDVVWHRTGDAGRLDDLGRLWLLGRIGSDVKMGDQRVFPFAVEVAARDWEGVKNVALWGNDTGAILVIEGNVSKLEIWQQNARKLGIMTVRHLDKIPMDKRHASKVDRKALAAKLR